ncbi:carboxymuconolactone decarboxylase family protein [Cupriavidus basilensis]
MARLPYFDVDNVPGRLGEQLRGRPALNLYRVLPHAPEIALGFLGLGRAILTQASLPPTLRELVILRVGGLSGASYEVHQHRRAARAAGVPEEKIDAVLKPDANGDFSELERLVIAFTDAVVHDVKAPAPLYAKVAAALDEQMMVELLATIGFYMLVSRLLENLEVDIENPPLEKLELRHD